MKKLITPMVAILMSTASYAQKLQEKDIPASVKESLKKAFPTAKDIKWEKEKGQYEAAFDLNKVDNSVLVDEKGTITETEVEIELSEFPQMAKDYIAKNYKEKIKEAAKITDAKGIITYEAEIKGKDLIFDATGAFIKETKD